MKRSFWLSCLLGAVFVVTGAAFVWAHVEIFFGTSAPQPVRWAAGGSVTYRINNQTSTALPNIIGTANPIAAIDAALQTIASETDLTLINGGTTAVTDAGNDGINLVTFAATPANAALTNGTVAVTLFTYNTSSLQLIDADIVFGPSTTFTASAASPAAFDIRSVATHEGGHFVGQDHSPLAHCTMYPFSAPGNLQQASLSVDDVAGLHALYPGAAVLGEATVTGSVTRAGAPVSGAHIVLQDVITGRTTVAGLSFPNGSFAITAVPEGLYHLYAEPLDGPVGASSFIAGTFATGVDATFRTAWLGGQSNPTELVVRGQATVNVGTLALSGPAATRDVSAVGLASSAATFAPVGSIAAVISIPPTGTAGGFLVIAGAGLQTLPDSAFSVSGSSIVLAAPSTASGLLSNGEGYKIFPYTTTSALAPGAYAVRVVDPATGVMSVLSGAIEASAAQSTGAFVAPFGTSCGIGIPPVTLTAVGPPITGNPAFRLQVSGTASGHQIYYLFSLRPEYLPILGVGGCTLAVDLQTLLLPLPGIQQSSTGSVATFLAPIPNSPAIAGLDLYVQALTLGPNSGLALSNGIQIHYE